jgi:hypothetical protein
MLLRQLSGIAPSQERHRSQTIETAGSPTADGCRFFLWRSFAYTSECPTPSSASSLRSRIRTTHTHAPRLDPCRAGSSSTRAGLELRARNLTWRAPPRVRDCGEGMDWGCADVLSWPHALMARGGIVRNLFPTGRVVPTIRYTNERNYQSTL